MVKLSTKNTLHPRSGSFVLQGGSSSMNFKCCVPCLNAPSALHVKEWGHSLSISMSYAEGLRPSGLLSLINTPYMWLRERGKGKICFWLHYRVLGLWITITELFSIFLVTVTNKGPFYCRWPTGNSCLGMSSPISCNYEGRKSSFHPEPGKTLYLK